MEIVNMILMKALEFGATYPAINTALVFLGAFVAVATVLKPVVYAIVNFTKTEKDNVIADKIYGVIEGTAIDFKPFVDLFKKKYPKFKTLDKENGGN
ncbi:MAG: hypothetical protein IJ752_06200 [Alphaproteobacteria bacterium]|nr:hypothetical protein [Alphaproteobacteria bacterium]